MSHEPEDPQAGPGSYSLPGTELRERCRWAGSREAFEQEHPHFWLVQDLECAQAKEPSFATAFVSEHGPEGMERMLGRRIGASPGSFAFFALKKSGNNPWKDRILIGRATNNDVVLRDASVSKVHARAVLRQGQWVVTDADSTNGTWVGGVQAGGAAASLALDSGLQVKFGHVVCTVLRSADLYDALVPGARG